MGNLKKANLRQLFWNDGFVVVPGFMVGEKLEDITQQLARYYEFVVPRLPPEFAYYEDAARPESLRQLNNLQLQDAYFEAAFGAEPWRSLAEALVGEAVECCGMQVHDKPPGFPYPTPPHQDNSSMHLEPPNAVAMWLAIDPADDENGCLHYVRGSHLTGLRPHITAPVVGFCRRIDPYGADDRDNEVAVHLKPGDLVVHHPLTIHRTGINQSDRRRRGFLQLFRGDSCQYNEAELSKYESEVKNNRVLNRHKNMAKTATV